MPSKFPSRHRGRGRSTFSLAVLAMIAILLSACSNPNANPTSATPVTPGAAPAYPASHIHGMDVDPQTSKVVLATHEGLFDVSTRPATRIGPEIDLMGFTVAANGTMYASGHPGPGVDLPEPAGLIESTDGGQSWTPSSRSGDSDFHALAAADQSIIGFDGELITSADGISWEVSDTQFPAYNLSATAEGPVALATTEDGLMRSNDAGRNWSQVAGAPLLLLTAMADTHAAGITPQGDVYVSENAGRKWKKRAVLEEQVSAMDLTIDSDGNPRIWVATDTAVHVSLDQGRTFSPIEKNQSAE